MQDDFWVALQSTLAGACVPSFALMSMQTDKRYTSQDSEELADPYSKYGCQHVGCSCSDTSVQLTRQHVVGGAVQKRSMRKSGYCNKGVMAPCSTDLWYRLSGSADYAGQLSHGQTDRPVHLTALALLC